VFASEVGTPIDAQNLVNRSFKPLLRRAGLPNIRFHDLRHTCATLLLVKGVHPKFVQNLLGHKSIKMTLDLYSHWIPDMGDHAAGAMDDLF
jgi:integrase